MLSQLHLTVTERNLSNKRITGGYLAGEENFGSGDSEYFANDEETGLKDIANDRSITLKHDCLDASDRHFCDATTFRPMMMQYHDDYDQSHNF